MGDHQGFDRTGSTFLAPSTSQFVRITIALLAISCTWIPMSMQV